MNIDETAQKIVSSFNAENNVMLKEETKEMLRQINYYENMFSVVKRPYLVAKSLYFMLTEDYLSEENQMSVIKLTYFCLLNNFLMNCNSKPGDAEYENLVSGCKLALVLISMQNQYLMYSIISGQARYINPETHIRNQVLLFGGIAKEAEIVHCNFPLEDIIKKYSSDGVSPRGLIVTSAHHAVQAVKTKRGTRQFFMPLFYQTPLRSATVREHLA